MGQIFWTHRDYGGSQFNYSKIVGNSAAVAISNAYYADNRTASEAVSKLERTIIRTPFLVSGVVKTRPKTFSCSPVHEQRAERLQD